MFVVLLKEDYERIIKESSDRAESLRLSQFYLSNCNTLLARIRKALGISGIEDNGETWFPNTEEAVKRAVEKANKLHAIENILSSKIPTYGTANGSK